MKYYWLCCLPLIVGCSNFYKPARAYTISDTHRECTGSECKAVTIILDARDCAGWDPKISYGWELCK
jgi:hypothetical protein